MTKVKYPESGTAITPDLLPWCITLKYAAEVLDISYRTIQHYVEEGRIPIVNLGHRTKRIYYKDLEDYASNRRDIDEAVKKFYRRKID